MMNKVLTAEGWVVSIPPASGGSGVTTAVVSGALAENDLVYLKADGTCALSDATAAGKEAIGFVRSTYANGDTATIYLIGNVMTDLAGLTPGAVYFMSTTPGEFASSAIAAAYIVGNVRMEVGTALSATELLFKPNTPIYL